MKYKYQKLGILLLILFAKCPPPPPNSNIDPPIESQNRITIFLVDRSGSFHKVQKEGNFKGQDYFQIACDQIKQYVEQQADKEHELIIVRVIESTSFTDDTVAAQINFANPEFIFREPAPKGAYSKYEKEAWQKRKDDFLNKVKEKRDALIQGFFDKIMELRKRGFSDKTDIVNAFKALLQDLKTLPHYPKHIIVYSDFKDNQNKLDASEVLDFGEDTEIEGRFVSLNDSTPDKYEALIEAWKRILKCKSKEFKTPIKSI